MSGLSDGLIETVHKLSSELRPGILDKLGLVKAIQWYAETFEQRTGISCPLDFDPADVDLLELDKIKSVAIFRIFQEIMTNILRHARATQALITVSIKSNALLLSVADNGIGMDEAKISEESGLGLLGMRERASAISGNLKIESFPGRGTKLVLSVPSALGLRRVKGND
jgi:signal transduction histidine kinase